MDLNTGLVMGIDIGRDKTQICYYDYADKGLKTDIYDNTEDCYEIIGKAVSWVMKQIKMYTVDKLCVTVYRFEKDILDNIRCALEKMQLTPQNYIILSHEECYAYYAFNQKSDLYKRGVMLIESEKEGMYCHLMRIMQNVGNTSRDIVCENTSFFDDLRNDDNGIIINKDSEKIIMEHIKETLGNTYVSSYYLTGAGFDTDKFPEEFTHFLCSGQRAFVGQNIYAKGACMCAANLSGSSKTLDVFENIILGCANRITTGIEMNILERGRNMRFRMVKPGVNWYNACRNVDFIIDDVNEINLIMRPCDGSGDYKEVISLDKIPYRKNKTTRVGFEIEFISDSTFIVTVEDKGFGEFFKGSGQVIRKEIHMR